MKKNYTFLIVLFLFLSIGDAFGWPEFSQSFSISEPPEFAYPSPVLDATGKVIKVPGCQNGVKVTFSCTRKEGEKINFTVDLILVDANNNFISTVGPSGSVKRVLYTDFGSLYTVILTI